MELLSALRHAIIQSSKSGCAIFEGNLMLLARLVSHLNELHLGLSLSSGVYCDVCCYNTAFVRNILEGGVSCSVLAH